MTKTPYALPGHLSPDLTRVLAYWRGLLRGAATMPFADDVNLADLPDLASRLFLVDVFQQPERFRFDIVGDSLSAEGLGGLFLDETALGAPFGFLRSQCTATVEAAGPTFYRHEAKGGDYARLLLPMWGEGAVSRLLGAVDLS